MTTLLRRAAHRRTARRRTAQHRIAHRPTVLAAVLLAGGVLLGACGIPLSNAAQPLPRSYESRGLLANPGTTTTTTPETSSDAIPIGIYFLDAAGTRLVETVARVQTQPAAAQLALDFLTYGPTASDSHHGLKTALSLAPQATLRVKIDKQSGVATVTLDYSTYYLPPVPEFQALAQIVYTITDPQLGAHSVVFMYAGSQVEAYLPDGQYVSTPVQRKDYASLAPAKVARRTSGITTSSSSAPHGAGGARLAP